MTTAADRVRAALGTLQTAVDDLNRAVGDIESCTVEEAAASLGVLRDLIQPLRQCEAGLERWIAQCFRHEGWDLTHELPGVGMVEVRRSKDRKAWQHDLLKSAWLNAYMDANGGEVTDPATVRDAFLDVVSVSGWKVTGLRALGIEPDEFCESSPGTPRVVIV